MDWQQGLYIIVAGLLIWFIFRGLRRNPEALSKENARKSFFTLGVLALILIAFVGFLVIITKG